jgi:hypothetical protein
LGVETISHDSAASLSSRPAGQPKTFVSSSAAGRSQALAGSSASSASTAGNDSPTGDELGSRESSRGSPLNSDASGDEEALSAGRAEEAVGGRVNFEPAALAERARPALFKRGHSAMAWLGARPSCSKAEASRSARWVDRAVSANGSTAAELFAELIGANGSALMAYEPYAEYLRAPSKSPGVALYDSASAAIVKAANSAVYLADGHLYAEDDIHNAFPSINALDLPLCAVFTPSPRFPLLRVENARLASLKAVLSARPQLLAASRKPSVRAAVREAINFLG